MSAPPLTGDQRLVKTINRMALLRLLRDAPGLSRASLAERSGLTRSTVGLLSRELLDEGWIAEEPASATGALGRRPTPLRLDGAGLALIGAELTPERLRIVVASIRGEIVETAQVPLRDADPQRACRQLADAVARVASCASGGGTRRLLGVGIGLPGAVDADSGMLRFAPNLGWRGLPIRAWLRAELHRAGVGPVPVHCRNDADLSAIGEVEFAPRAADDPLVFVSCGVGVGAGIVLGGTLFHGATGAGGEIGHTTLHIDGRPCSCGRRGCAEAYVGLRAIVAAVGGAPGAAGLAALRDAAAARRPEALAAFAAAGASLGVLLHNVWTTFDPQAIVLGGEAVALGGAAYVDAALLTLERCAQAAGLRRPEVRVARYAEQAVAAGAAAYALHALMNPHRPAPTHDG